MSSRRHSDDERDSSQWDKVWSIFHDALDASVEDRTAFVDAACKDDEKLKSDVTKLLAAHAAAVDEDTLSSPLTLAGILRNETSNQFKAGDRIGPYELIDIIGEGGMGVVYRARQDEPVKREVAIKLLQAGIATREIMARFEAERQALAIMNHSNIAKIHDAGSTPSGQPYIVMEYVVGVPVTKFCDEQHLGIAERLQLFERICDGVLHAHQKGVIHRDIKPSNVLVTLENGQPVPKIIDFGIAKTVLQTPGGETLYTQMGAMIGTPDYMSPEQAGVVLLDVDTRADVYSLGILLYELLFGGLPFKSLTTTRGLLEVQEAIRDEEPQHPGARFSQTSKQDFEELSQNRTTTPPKLRRLFDGDVTWVALKAIEKDRTRRYTSVAELLADLNRYQSGLPVSARAPTRLYRAAKFVRRHKFGVTVSAIGAMLALVFAGFMTLQTLRLQRALDETTLQRDRAGQVSDFMVQLFEGANPEVASGDSITAETVLERGAVQLRTELTDQPELRAKLLATVGESFRVMGGDENADQAITLLGQALTDLQSVSPLPTADLGAVHNLLGSVYHDLGKYEEAERHYDDAIEWFRRTSDESLAGLADALGNLGVLHTDRGNLSDAAELMRESVELQKRAHGERSSEVARATQRLGYILHRQGESELALPIMLDALTLLKENHGDDHAYVATALNYAASAFNATSDARSAQSMFSEAADIYRDTHGSDHPYLANTLSNLALSYNRTNDFQLAIDALDEAMRIGVANYGADHPNVNSFRVNIGTNLQDMGRYAEAEPFLRKGLERDRFDLDAGSKYLFVTIDRLGSLLDSLGQQEEAQRLLQEAVDLRRKYLGERHADTGVAHSHRAANLLGQGKLDAAEIAGRTAVDILGEAESGSDRLAASLVSYVKILLANGELQEAAQRLKEASLIYRDSAGVEALSIAKLQIGKAELARQSGNAALASDHYAAAEEIIRESLGGDHPELAGVLVASGRLSCEAGDTVEGARKIRNALPTLERSLGQDNWQLQSVRASLAVCRIDASE